MSSIGDDVASSTLLSIILGLPILVGIGIILTPFVIISTIIGVPLGTLVKSLLVFGAAVFFVWLFSKHQIIENGIVGLTIGILTHSYFNIHPVFCILIGIGVIIFLFIFSNFKIGFWIKASIFSFIVSFLIWGAFYSSSGLLPAPDKIWGISFFIIFFLENMYIRFCVWAEWSELFSGSEKPLREHQEQKTNQDIPVAATVEEKQTQQHPIPKENPELRIEDVKAEESNMEKMKHTTEDEKIEITKVWDSRAEETAYKILNRKVNLDRYQISKHIALREIFKNMKKEPWMDWHIDFVIEDAKGYPVLGIEINGIEHWNDPKCKERDRKKKSLFEQAGIPLVCIPLPELPSFTKEEYKTEYENALEGLMDKYLMPFHDKTSYPVYCYTCGQQLAYRFRKDHTGSFYCCLNKECNSKSKTISSEIIPQLLQ